MSYKEDKLEIFIITHEMETTMAYNCLCVAGFSYHKIYKEDPITARKFSRFPQYEPLLKICQL